MPVSHLGLTVSHVPSAISFYLAALKPLGYKYFGAQGDSVGLGVGEADFFLSQAADGVRPTPTHIAFRAPDCVSVRDCYDTAIRAGGQPSGRPSFRKDDCKCFNAAVEDLDGNTVEFIWRDTGFYQEPIKTDLSSRSMVNPRPLPVRTRAQSVYHPPSDTSPPRGSGLQRSRTEPIDGFSPKALFGTMLGAAAGAAVAYAIVRSERDGSRNEARYSTMYARGRTDDLNASRNHRRSASVSVSDRPDRTYTAAIADSKPRHQSNSARLLMPATTSRSYVDDAQVEYRRQRVSRTSSGRSQMYEAVEVGPGKFSSRRSATLPVEQSRPLLVEQRSSRNGSARGSFANGHSQRHDSVVSASSHRSYRTAEPIKPPTLSQASTIKPERRGSLYADSAVRVPLPPSVTSTKRASKTAARRPESALFDAYYLPVDTPNDALRDDQIDDDGLDDMRTVVPDDSISCIDLPRTYSHPKPRKSERHKGHERAVHDSRGQENKSRPRRGSTATAPLNSHREREQTSKPTYSTVR